MQTHNAKLTPLKSQLAYFIDYNRTKKGDAKHRLLNLDYRRLKINVKSFNDIAGRHAAFYSPVLFGLLLD